MELKTPLYEMHLKLHGKMVPFAGYLLPIQYEEGIIKEHMAVRTRAGIFDVSHMGEIRCSGKDALRNLQQLLTNDFTDMSDGQARYSPMCNEQGGTVDDLIVYKKKEEEYLIVVNASNKEKDYHWMLEHKFGEVVFEDISDKISQIALQGPKSQEILMKLSTDIPEKYYHAVFDGMVAGIPCMISRTGYTGEDGFELYLDNTYAKTMWETLMEAGKEYGLIPCGLGARDTLRLEAGMPLYGHEMNDEINPVETGLSFAVKMQKEDFIGKDHLPDKDSLMRKRVGLRVTGRGIIREQEDVLVDGKKVGFTTSGTHCPYLGYPVAMAILNKEYIKVGTKVTVIVRGREVEAEVVPLPFYKRTK
ncbi:glycine cleavage system aminomethyltransferase GcvT [Lachnoclostridium phytofermentans]|uniref:Aminomethyltransferase n=1 Tax=Lachnoclostridium phytofermentans (strain ATCC 700394 / DSM 18823 / ISDg) TaxID=357809 RepID=A9KQJ9_LACP7|nr:glycine cleavage system aminomethyltransferase GcvT [Lachnoclostridium phytofermentans]ABX41912.1 glycine cleavage system T protein [Lachnoclostridium phytofermentans ISDg]